MNAINCLHQLQRLGTFLMSTTLMFTILGVGVAPTFSTPLQQSIAQKITQLQTSGERWIQIDLKKQRLIAWEGKTPVHAVIISTGKKSTPTLPGIFKIQTKIPKQRMRGDGYDVPDVPFVMFYEGNYAIHGAYWHRQFGTPVSHGCVNVAVDHAEWLFEWASVGTPVVIK